MFKNIIFPVLAVVSILSLSGCGIVRNQTVNNSQLREIASKSIGVKPDVIHVSNVSHGIIQVTFDAKVDGLKHRIYKCEFASDLYSTSDALCNPVFDSVSAKIKSEEKHNSKHCNALLHAAGKC